jgi:N-acyl-L-homoserine lactone synthetase
MIHAMRGMAHAMRGAAMIPSESPGQALRKSQGNTRPKIQRSWTFVESLREPDSSHYVYTAKEDDDLAAVDALWNAVYGDEFGWLKKAAKPHYLDRFHKHSAYLVAKAEGRTVGTMRLVGDSPEGLPVEQFTSISELRGQRTLIECTRLMILPEYRNRSWQEMPFGVLGALFKGCLHWSIVNGYSHIIADLFTGTKTTPMAILLGMGFEETGKEFIDTELHEPDRSVALLLEVGELFSRSFRTERPFYRYLMAYDERIDVYTRSA